MKTKKLWLWSFIFGLLATALLYFFITSRPGQNAAPISAFAESSKESKNVSSNGAQTTASKVDNGTLPISEGKRAMSIQVPEIQGVAGYIKSGAHVDVAAKLTVPGGAQPGQSNAETMVIQNAKVLALGHAADNEDAKKRYQIVTLEVSPKEALTLGFAAKYEFYLLLRKDGDEKLEPDHAHVFENDLHEGVFLK